MSSTSASESFGILPEALHTQLREFPDRAFAQTAAVFEQARHTLLKNGNDDQTRFQDGLTLKAFIDGASERCKRVQVCYVQCPVLIKLTVIDCPIEDHESALLGRCAAVLNAEYVLFHIYKDVELPVNPFLSHWVDHIARWEGKGAKII